MDYIDVRTFIEEFRSRVGDSTQDIPTKNILTSIRHALNYLAREKGLQRLFEYEDTFDLLRMKDTGEYANEWALNGDDFGYIFDIQRLDVIDNTSKPCLIDVQYIPYRWFIKEYPLPNMERPGSPSAFTLKTTQGKTSIIFNSPIARPHAIVMHYSAAHPRITKETDIIRIPYLFIDMLVDLVTIFYYKEAADFSFARSQYEDLDYQVSQIRELLHQQPTFAGPRTIRRSY